MNKIIILLLILFPVTYTQAQETNPKINYYVKYVFDEKGNIYQSEATLQFALGNLYVLSNNDKKTWKCIYKGIIKRKDNGADFYYYQYYLPTINVEMFISKEKEIKHGDTFYYRIIFAGQTQLAL